jgi:hypothetical protein
VFSFNPIKLTTIDSDSLHSHGFIQFAIKLRAGLNVGDQIANTAHIYFDFNPAVVTNTALTTIKVVSTFEPFIQPKINVFPNPADRQVTLQLPQDINGLGILDLFTSAGHLLYSNQTTQNIHVIPLQDFSAGTYWCRWTAGGSVYWGKLSVQH